MDNVIPFPGTGGETEQERISTPQRIFTFDDAGNVDLAEGVTVTDAVTDLWLALSAVVREAWEESVANRERARVRLLVAYLDKVRPGWRNELQWED